MKWFLLKATLHAGMAILLFGSSKSIADTLSLKVESPCFTAAFEFSYDKSDFELEKLSARSLAASCEPNLRGPTMGRENFTLSEKDVKQTGPFAILGSKVSDLRKATGLYYRYEVQREDLAFDEIWVFPWLGKIALVPSGYAPMFTQDLNGVILNNVAFVARGGLLARGSRTEQIDFKKPQVLTLTASSADPLRGAWLFQLTFLWDGQTAELKSISRSNFATVPVSRNAEPPRVAPFANAGGFKLIFNDDSELSIQRSGKGYDVFYGGQLASLVKLESQGTKSLETNAKQPSLLTVEKSFFTQP